MSQDQPKYHVYRSRRNPFAGLMDRLRPARREGRKPKEPKKRGEKKERPLWRKVLKWFLIWVAFWLVLSLVLFMVSAWISSSKIDDSTKDALSDSGNLLTSPNTILVLGSDKRKKESSRGRSDTILLWRFDGGRSAKLSIPRDTRVSIPGYGIDKINAAYAFGGPALTVRTIEYNFSPIKINHIIIVNFEGFSELVDSLGGVTMKLDNCIRTTFEGKTLRLKSGEHHLDGDTALGVVRTRKNRCGPSENDLTRARRQQQFLEAVKSRIRSPVTFLRLPWVAWSAPGAFESDMGGFGLISLFLEMQRASAAKPKILPVEPLAGTTQLQAVDPDYHVAIERFLEGK